MPKTWYKITLKESSLEEVVLPAKFLGVTLNKPEDAPSSALWLQQQGVKKGEAWYFIETESPNFQQIVREFKAEPCPPPDMSLLSPIARKSRSPR